MSDVGLNFKVGRLFKLEGNGAVKGFADIVVNDSLLLRGLRVLDGKNGMFVSFPREQGKDKRWYETVHPITKEAREQISQTVIEAYNGK